MWQGSSRAIAMELGFQLGFLVFCHVLIGSQVSKQKGRGEWVNIRSGLYGKSWILRTEVSGKHTNK